MVEKKAPIAARPRPISSGCWCPRCFVARLRLRTREGVRGLSRRFLRRRATAEHRLAVDLDVELLQFEKFGADHLGDGDRVVYRRAPEVVDPLVEGAVE